MISIKNESTETRYISSTVAYLLVTLTLYNIMDVVTIIIIIVIIIQIKHLYKQFGDGSSSLPPHLQQFKGVPTQWILPETKQPEHEAYHSFPSRANIEIAQMIPSTLPYTT